MKRHLKFVLILLGATAIVGQLYAQPTEPAPGATASNDQSPKVQLSSEQMTKEARVLRDRVRLDIQRLQHLQTLARKQNDVIKLSCVNDKLVRMKAGANLFDTAHREFLGMSDTDEGRAAFAELARSGAEVRRIREEADGCIGEPELGAESANDFTSPDILDDPTVGLPFDVTVEPPAYASPYT